MEELLKQNPCRYCALGLKYRNKYIPSYSRQECQVCENLKSHERYLKSKRKYRKTERIESFSELLSQTWVYVGYSTRPTHIEAIKSWQVRIVLDVLGKGNFYKTIENGGE